MKIDSDRLRRLRLARAWSQEQLAEMTSLNVRTIQRIENGESASLETLSALAAVFEVSVDELSEAATLNEPAITKNIAAARKRLRQEQRFYKSLLVALTLCPLLYLITNDKWVLWLALAWGILLFIKALRLFFLRSTLDKWQSNRLQKLLRK